MRFNRPQRRQLRPAHALRIEPADNPRRIAQTSHFENLRARLRRDRDQRQLMQT